MCSSDLWPLVRSAAALLTEVAEGEDPGPTQPGAMAASEGASLAATAGVAGPDSGLAAPAARIDAAVAAAAGVDVAGRGAR